MKRYAGLFLLALSLLAACAGQDPADQTEEKSTSEDNVERNNNNITVSLEAEESKWSISENLSINGWLYNDSLPGEEIRVTEGDQVKVNFTNSLDEPTAVHFHGVPVDNKMDGVPGVTQNVVMPGESFTYEIDATLPGTYWYHSHQNGAEQVIDKGLYGSFIIEEEDNNYDTDEVIMLSEVSSMMNKMDEAGMERHGMDSEGGSSHMSEMDENMAHHDQMKEMYDTLVINGKSDPKLSEVNLREGEKAKLRFVNSGLATKVIAIPHDFKVTHYDGQPVNEPETITDHTGIRLGSAERVDIEIDASDPGAYGIEIFSNDNPENLQAVVPLRYEGEEKEELVTQEVSDYLDISSYGTSKDQEDILQDIDNEVEAVLGTNDGGHTYTINGKQMETDTADGHEIYEIEDGDIVKMKITNETDVDHPMHLHGSFFKVMAKNGEKVSGSPIKKDTLNVRPGEEYEIVFKADNPGNWLFHCHEFHHAGGGMVSEIKYKGFEPAETIDPGAPNQPE
ncbi:multicopper oxidase family protein [Halobacillus sp. Marseille-P3879]|uniref:multicopper oxidase family protein n=1 Tax=Halobacillus sp. Marseille-P3879 TaxID=2045014 RepID=UPI001F1EA7B7|nr:multicopper oxidase family protein [Halobacillus sp. Marseille-P3879]